MAKTVTRIAIQTHLKGVVEPAAGEIALVSSTDHLIGLDTVRAGLRPELRGL
jgi:phosphotransferase system IIA component